MLGDSVRRRQPQKRAKAASTDAAKPRRAGKRNWKPWLIGLPLALTVPAAIGYAVAVFMLFPPTEASGAGIVVPELVGESASEAQRALAAAGLGPLEIEELPHPGAPAGEVVAQSPLPGQQLRPGASVRVALSSGPPRALVPDVLGFSATRAESLLRRAGFDVSIVEQESTMAAGRVLRTEPQPGREQMLPALVTLIVSAGRPQAPPADTLDDGVTDRASMDGNQ